VEKEGRKRSTFLPPSVFFVYFVVDLAAYVFEGKGRKYSHLCMRITTLLIIAKGFPQFV
jgi:hypothetical protein